MLWKSSVTQERVNLGQKAHIYSFSEVGPRGNAGVERSEINSLKNLLLVCHECHRKIDRLRDGGRYTVPVLREMKASHEERIQRVTGIAPEKKSHVLLYGANIGQVGSPLNYESAASALFPDRYPATDTPIKLGTVNSSFRDRDTSFWATEAEHLRRKFSQRVGDPLADGDIHHLSVFGLAPQPLLVLLGSLLTDIIPADVYQLHREPTTWQWPSSATFPQFIERIPPAFSGAPALVLGLSATVTEDRVREVLGDDAGIWMVTVEHPHNDVIKSRKQLSELRTLLRRILDRVKAMRGQKTILHVFPAASVSSAIELGRVRMPKADMPWLIYDQISVRGGFVPALSIGDGG